MTYSQIRQWGIVMILGMSLLTGCAGATPTPEFIPLAATPTPLPPQPPAAQPVATQVLPTNTAPSTAPAQPGGADPDLTTTPDGSVTATVVLPTMNPLDQPFLMRIDRISVIVGRGTLLEGRVAHGTLPEGSGVEILGPQNVSLNPSVLGVFISNTQAGQVTVGDYAGVLVDSTQASEVAPGMLVAAAGAYESYEEALQELQ